MTVQELFDGSVCIRVEVEPNLLDAHLGSSKVGASAKLYLNPITA